MLTLSGGGPLVQCSIQPEAASASLEEPIGRLVSSNQEPAEKEGSSSLLNAQRDGGVRRHVQNRNDPREYSRGRLSNQR